MGADHEVNLAEWHGKDIVDSDGDRIGKLEDVYVYVDVETDEPMFGTVKEGLLGRLSRLYRSTGSRSGQTVFKSRSRGLS
jgi:PRC-barrel domain protein